MNAPLTNCPFCNDRGWECIGHVDGEAVWSECVHCERGRLLARARLAEGIEPDDEWISFAVFFAIVIAVVVIAGIAYAVLERLPPEWLS